MKNIRLIVAICAALMIAAPAMALEVEVSGHYFIEAFNNSNENLRPDDGTDDYGTMEFMAKPVFKINDNITLTTQFTALQDHIWGDDTLAEYSTFPFPVADGGTPQVDNSSNFDWKAAYLTIKTPIGGFIVGRYIDTPWGTTIGDSTASHGSNSLHKDRIMWVVPVGNFISGAVYQKMEENDKGADISDQDFSKAYLFSAYKQENWSTGLLFANYHHKNYLASANLNRAINNAALFEVLGNPAFATAADAAYETKGSLKLWVLDPYFKGNFGPVGIQAELLYGWGDIEQDDDSANDLDAKGLGYMFDLSYDFGPVSCMVGTSYAQGDWDFEDDEANSMGYFEQSLDHERGFLLTSDVSNLQGTLGGRVETLANINTVAGMPMGNVSGGPTTVTGQAGYQMFYFDVAWQALEKLKLGFFFVSSTADDVPKTSAGVDWDDDHGQEYDFTLEWDIMDNLAFKGIVAYLDAGDYWKQGDPDYEIEDNTTFYGRLTVEF